MVSFVVFPLIHTTKAQIGDNIYTIGTWQTISYSDFESGGGIVFNFSREITGDFNLTIDASNLVPYDSSGTWISVDLFNVSFSESIGASELYGYQDWITTNVSSSDFFYTPTGNDADSAIISFENPENDTIISMVRSGNMITYGYTGSDEYTDTLMASIDSIMFSCDNLNPGPLSGSLSFIVSSGSSPPPSPLPSPSPTPTPTSTPYVGSGGGGFTKATATPTVSPPIEVHKFTVDPYTFLLIAAVAIVVILAFAGGKKGGRR